MWINIFEMIKNVQDHWFLAIFHSASRAWCKCQFRNTNPPHFQNMFSKSGAGAYVEASNSLIFSTISAFSATRKIDGVITSPTQSVKKPFEIVESVSTKTQPALSIASTFHFVGLFFNLPLESQLSFIFRPINFCYLGAMQHSGRFRDHSWYSDSDSDYDVEEFEADMKADFSDRFFRRRVEVSYGNSFT